MKKTIVKKYKTTHLDEAVFFVLKGFRYKTTKLKDKHSVWTFEESKKLEIARKQFWGGNALINLHKWIALRAELKWQQKSIDTKCITVEELEDKEPTKNDLVRELKEEYGMILGNSYYWINEENNILPVLAGRRNIEIHLARFREGTGFRTQLEASNARHLRK